jgi:hypothetical protein
MDKGIWIIAKSTKNKRKQDGDALFLRGLICYLRVSIMILKIEYSS